MYCAEPKVIVYVVFSIDNRVRFEYAWMGESDGATGDTTISAQLGGFLERLSLVFLPIHARDILRCVEYDVFHAS